MSISQGRRGTDEFSAKNYRILKLVKQYKAKAPIMRRFLCHLAVASRARSRCLISRNDPFPKAPRSLESDENLGKPRACTPHGDYLPSLSTVTDLATALTEVDEVCKHLLSFIESVYKIQAT